MSSVLGARIADRMYRDPTFDWSSASWRDSVTGEINSPTFLSSEPAPYATGTRTPPERTGTNRRKQTLLALIDELAALREEEIEKEREISHGLTKDERASGDAEGVERFQAFDERIRGLDLKLQAFANAVRQLGSSVGLLNAAYHLRARLRQIQYFFQENAAELFDGVPHAPNVGTKPYSARKRGKVRRHMAVGPENNKLWSTEIEDLPGEMENLAKDLDVFLNRLNDVPEFTDEAVNASIKAFEGIYGQYRASCLREFEGQLKYSAVSRYINDLTEDLGMHMDSMKESLNTFIDVGVPTIRFSQKHTATGLQNLSTVATFFSGVTATTLQFSFEAHNDAVQNLVNGLWISSLVFSIASAINSQLAYHWRAAMYRSPRCYVPWWVSIWITRTPLFFLVGSVIAFSAGLCVFTYSSDQSPAVSAVVTSFTVVTSSALLCVGLWFASERWTFARTKGSRWLLDILEEHGEKAGKVTGITPTKQAAKRGAQRTQTLFKDVKRSMTSASERVVGVAGRMGSAVDVIKAVPRDFMRTMSSLAIVTDGTSSNARGDEESQDGTYRTDSPTAMFNGDNSSGSLGVNPQSEKRKLSDLGRSNEEPIPEHEPLTLDTRTAPGLVVNPPSAAPTTPGSTSNSSNSPHVDPGPSEQPQPNARLRALTRRVIHTFRLVPHNHPPSPPVRSMSSPSVMSDSRHRRDSSEHELIPARIQTYVPMLRTLRSSQLLTEHVALVKHLQFSPDGKFLATCSWDRTALIWRVGAGPYGEFELMHKLVHTARVGGFVGQVAWSPNGEQLLTKQLKSIKVWSSKTGVCERTIDQKRSVQAITWMPKGQRFLSIEWKTESSQADKRFNMRRTFWAQILLLYTDGTKLQEHHLPRLQVWDAAVVPDEERLVAVATLIRTEQERRPVKSRHEKRILIYNLNTKEIENQVPLLQEVRDITLTEEGNYALVSYENKAPPQAWRIDKILREGKQRLVLAHTYFTKYPVDFAGPSYFGGVKDTFVLAASKSGEIYIWERSSGVLLHSLKAPDQELTNLAWNHKSQAGSCLHPQHMMEWSEFIDHEVRNRIPRAFVRSNDDFLTAEPSSYLRGGSERPIANPAKRKQTLLALLSELSDLRDAEDFDKEVRDSAPSNGSTGALGVETVQDSQSREGVAIFLAFDNHVTSLDRQLQGFANAVRQLGSSVGLLNATYYLRGSLIQIEYLFRENAADLFSEIRRKRDGSRDSPLRATKAERDRVHTGMRPQIKPLKDIEQLPEEMDRLAQQIHVFVNRLNDIPEFTDELVNASFISFASDLRYRASCLREFKGQLKTSALQRYINDLSTDIGTHMESMNEALTNFVEVGVPTIRHAQTHTANGLQYLSAVATFFSGVTATTIQYSFDQTGNTRADMVNAMWIISLIFSIASAINSQLAYHWRAAIYRSPRNYVPWWVSIWIKRSPLFFLIGSVIAFSIGLCVFTYSSRQSPVVSALVTAFTIVTSSGLISVGLWFMSERWIFSRTRGKRWLFDVLNETQAKINRLLGITWVLKQFPEDIGPRLMRWSRLQVHNIRTALQMAYIYCTCRSPSEIDEEKQAHLSDFAADPPRSSGLPPRPSGARSDDDTISIADTNYSALASPRFTDKQPLPTSTSMTSIPSSSSGHPRETPPGFSTVALPATITEGELERPPPPRRLKSLVERIIAINKSAPGRTVSGRTDLESTTGRPRASTEGYIPSSYALKARLTKLKPGLENLRITQFMTEHMALVKHMQFSPNGDYLATCSWDRTAIIWKIGDTVEMCMKLYHPVSSGGFVNQVAWSPDGERLLTRTQKAIKIWNPYTGISTRTITRGRSIQYASWMPSGNGFLAVEYKSQSRAGQVTATNLVQLDAEGKVLYTHILDRIQIWDTAIMADEVRVLAVGTLVESRDRLQPIQSRAEKRLLIYNLKTNEVEHHVPLLQEVRNISLSTPVNKVTHALVSHENKSPPQMWRIDMKTTIRPGEHVARLVLVHSYLTKTPVEFAGQSFFGGPDEMFVCCSSKSGEMYVWDRISATLLHTLRPDDMEVIKIFACNRRAIPRFMLVSGALDGTLRVWSSPASPPPSRQLTSSPELQASLGSSSPQRGGCLTGDLTMIKFEITLDLRAPSLSCPLQ
ncbi:WD repeat protein [Rhizoctonia solani]|uniref:WD repeat protein n=1 Tax=Rhizoctonia solani TaxID=456999 RepID=A0A8H8NU98_9AGAM|nr:WD repeat protein [Rhizoctonia solani]QRW18765.1 WD repeat protein [Rhizoctonia solani]